MSAARAAAGWRQACPTFRPSEPGDLGKAPGDARRIIEWACGRHGGSCAHLVTGKSGLRQMQPGFCDARRLKSGSAGATVTLMLRRTLILCLIAVMATTPALASVCATRCIMSGSSAAHAGASADCEGGATSQHEPADADGSDASAMGAACALAASGVISVLVSTIALPGGTAPADYKQTFPTSLPCAPPAEPPRS